MPVASPYVDRHQWRHQVSWPSFLFASALSSGIPKAVAASERRYKFPTVKVPQPADSRWSYGEVLTSLGSAPPALVTFDQIDFDDLMESDSLLPLTPYLNDDPDFDVESYWPGVLDTGRSSGIQFGLPLSVGLWVTVFNEDLAQAVAMDSPPRGAFDRETFLQSATRMQMARSIPDQERTVGFDFSIKRSPFPSGDVDSMTPGYVFLQAAVGEIRDPSGSFQPLQTNDAIDTVGLIHDMITEHGFTSSDGYWEGNTGMICWLLGRGEFWFKTGSPMPNSLLYPFPAFQARVHPAEVWSMIGIPKLAPDPGASYDALRFLGPHLRNAMFIPAVRVSAPKLREMSYAALSDDEAAMVVGTLENASYLTLSRRERGILANAIDGGIFHRGKSADDALRDAIRQLEELR
jgi:hypothetical protein